MLIRYSVAGAAAAFVCLNVYLIRTLKKGMVTIDESSRTLVEVRNSVQDLTQEAKNLIRNANQITVDVKGKIKTVDPLLESFEDVGEVIHSVTDSFRHAAGVIGNGNQTNLIHSTPKVQIKTK